MPVFLPREPHNSMKKQKDMTPENEPPGQKVSNMLLGKNRGQLQIAPERMKWLDQSGNRSVVDMSGGESKVQCCKEQYFIEI